MPTQTTGGTPAAREVERLPGERCPERKQRKRMGRNTERKGLPVVHWIDKLGDPVHNSTTRPIS